MKKIKRIVCYWKAKHVITRIIQYENDTFAFQYKRNNNQWRAATTENQTLKACTKAMLDWRKSHE